MGVKLWNGALTYMLCLCYLSSCIIKDDNVHARVRLHVVFFQSFSYLELNRKLQESIANGTISCIPVI